MSALLLDIGNSRCKWGLWQQGQITDSGALAHEIADDPTRWTFAQGIERAVACNVAGEGAGIRVGTALREAVGPVLEFAVTNSEQAGVRCGYDNPSRLGIDRWMAVLAASRQSPRPCIVVDAGTAMTIDALDGERCHLGGYIIPGLQMMQRALTSRTANIRIDADTPPAERFGNGTSEAVRNGALTALTGSIQRAVEQLSRETQTPASALAVLFTGGDGQMLMDAMTVASSASLSHESAYRANLVLEGLAIYAELAE